jgi:hypothetical protein
MEVSSEELLDSVSALGREPDISCFWPAFDLGQGLLTPADEQKDELAVEG